MISTAEIARALEDAIFKIKPDIVIFQGASFHHDHTIAHEAGVGALRPNARFQPREILFMSISIIGSPSSASRISSFQAS